MASIATEASGSSTTSKEFGIENRYAAEASHSEAVEAVSAMETEPSPDAPTAKPENAVVYSPELLQMYYSRLFPFEMLYQWLSYGNGETKALDESNTNQNSTRSSTSSNNNNNNHTFTHREFSFTIEPVPGEEIYLRYQSFATQSQLSAAILKRRPVKIDIGAVFSHPPSDHHTVAKTDFCTMERELVFDIDLTDYDDVRRCGCTGASICRTCWGYMTMAVQVMDEGLREDFGFEHVAWFYSGRRGIHCWVCDESARALTDAGRSAVASYFEVNLGTDKNKDVHLPYPLHPMLSRAFDALEPLFVEQVLPSKGHGLLATEDQWTALLNTLPEAAQPVRDNLIKVWSKPKCASTPEEKWRELRRHLDYFASGKAGSAKAAQTVSSKDRAKVELWAVETVFLHTYPRLDINVSKMRNHLLKSPFCVHPKTGRVCVPIRPEQAADFDPFAVPTLPQLMAELDEACSTGNGEMDETDSGDGKGRPDWSKTSLKAYFEPFQKKFLEPLEKELRRAKREEKEQKAALVGDF